MRKKSLKYADIFDTDILSIDSDSDECDKTLIFNYNKYS